MRKKRMAVLIAILTVGNVWGCGNPGLSESAVMGQTADYSKEEPETVREENSSVPWTSVAAVDSRTHPMIAFEDAAPEVRDAVEQYQEEKYREDRSFLYLQKLSVLWENKEETVLYAYCCKKRYFLEMGFRLWPCGSGGGEICEGSYGQVSGKVQPDFRSGFEDCGRIYPEGYFCGRLADGFFDGAGMV
ncbi:hypothetical protein [Cuneatibacter caecimuris]|uniref:hypothetical protein n=1 Tax=Cuneatibacter caecimuris TaxID=1796618 RepID=UPI00102BC993|nr:hypothetical protein [Cuneatibacter caecimuris]